jgi:hypothetical protein
MRQSRLSGSVEGVMGNHDSYSDYFVCAVYGSFSAQSALKNAQKLMSWPVAFFSAAWKGTATRASCMRLVRTRTKARI